MCARQETNMAKPTTPAKITWVGDPASWPAGTAPAHHTRGPYLFLPGVPLEIDDESYISQARDNPFFTVDDKTPTQGVPLAAAATTPTHRPQAPTHKR